MNEIDGPEKVKIGLAAIGAIVVIVAIGLLTGHDGVIAGSGMAVIGAVMGAVFGFSYRMVKA